VLLGVAKFGGADRIGVDANFQPHDGILPRRRILLALSDLVGNESPPANAIPGAAKVVEHPIEVIEDAKCFDGAATFG